MINDIPATIADPAFNVAGTEFAINAWDVGRAHTTVLTLEATANITYEIEIVRHFELIPGEEAPHEMRSAQLSDAFSSPIDLLRKFRINDVVTNPFAPPMISLNNQITVW